MVHYGSWMFSVKKFTPSGNVVMSVISRMGLLQLSGLREDTHCLYKQRLWADVWLLQTCVGCICFHLKPANYELAWDRDLLPQRQLA